MLLLGGCQGGRGCQGRAPAAAGGQAEGRAPGDGGTRAIRSIAELPPLGPSPDGREIDLPLGWVFLLSDPAPTGSAPYAAVGATVPCGFVPAWTVSTKAPGGLGQGGEIRLRMRARWQGSGAPTGGREPCRDRPEAVQLVSLSVLRLGPWRVRDEIAHGPGDPVLTEVVQRVVADDSALRPPAERWTRPCAADADCPGGLCAAVGAGRVCLPPRDPWRHNDQDCPGGTRAVSVTHTRPGEGPRSWEACVAACPDGGGCPGTLRCDPVGVCVPGDAPVSPG